MKEYSYRLLVVVVVPVFSVLAKCIMVVVVSYLLKNHTFPKEIADNYRLGCQVKVKEDMEISIPEEVFGVKKWEATVVSNYNVASFIKEFIVEIPEDMPYEAGGYIQIEIPDCEINYADMDITAHPDEHDEAEKFKLEWDKFGLWSLKMKNDEEVVRAYSMASYLLKEDV